MSIRIPSNYNLSYETYNNGPNSTLVVGDHTLPVGDIVRMLDFLVDFNAMTEDERHVYYQALMGHYYHGILPGFQRFTIPGSNLRLFFIPALRVMWDNFVLDPSEIQTIRLEWSQDGRTPAEVMRIHNHNPEWTLTQRRDGLYVDDIGDVIDFDGIFDDLEAINHAIWAPEAVARPVSPTGIEEFPVPDDEDMITDEEVAEFLAEWRQ